MAEKKKPKAHTPNAIPFPYVDLATATTVARAILNSGGQPIKRDQLAGAMKTTTKSGTFMMKLAAAKMFGLVGNMTGGTLGLTSLAFAILDKDENRQRAARRDAFLKAPLYRRIYDEFRGKQLPPRPHGLEQAIANFGVSQKQKKTARLAFDKSATQAGFFSANPDRLIEPIIAGAPPQFGEFVESVTESEGEVEVGRTDFGATQGGEKLHPFVKGLIDTLPQPKAKWGVNDRVKWLRAAAYNFDLMYTDGGEIKIEDVKAANEPKAKPEDDDEIPF